MELEMKAGQKIRNVCDRSSGLTIGSVYTLRDDNDGSRLLFMDDDGKLRNRFSKYYESAEPAAAPEGDKVLEFLKARAQELYTSIPTNQHAFKKYEVVLGFLRDYYGLAEKIMPLLEFVPING